MQHFNSIKVRLNHVFSTADTVTKTGFQFHKGTIKPGNGAFKFHSSVQFQFHKGTIKPGDGTFRFHSSVQFQFHKGTIKPFCLIS